MAKLDALSASVLRRFWADYLHAAPEPQHANVTELLEMAQHSKDAAHALADLIDSRGLVYVEELAQQFLAPSSSRKDHVVRTSKKKTMAKVVSAKEQQVPKQFVVDAACLADLFGLSGGSGTFGFELEGKQWMASYNGKRAASPLTIEDVAKVYASCVGKKKASRVAIRREDLDQALQLTEQEMENLPEQEFYDLTATVVNELETLGQKVKDIDAVFKRLRASRLLKLCTAYKGKVVQIREAVLQLTESKPSTPYKEILDALLLAKPELQAMVSELTAAKLESKPPTQILTKYLLSTEPSTWKKLQHETLGALPRQQEQVDVRSLALLLEDHLRRLDTIMERLQRTGAGLAYARTLARFNTSAATASRPELLQQAVKLLQQVDFGQDPNKGIPVLEQARKLVQSAGVQPTDIELAIRTWAEDADKAKGFITGPSSRGSNKGAIADLSAMVEKAKNQPAK